MSKGRCLWGKLFRQAKSSKRMSNTETRLWSRSLMMLSMGHTSLHLTWELKGETTRPKRFVSKVNFKWSNLLLGMFTAQCSWLSTYGMHIDLLCLQTLSRSMTSMVQFGVISHPKEGLNPLSWVEEEGRSTLKTKGCFQASMIHRRS